MEAKTCYCCISKLCSYFMTQTTSLQNCGIQIVLHSSEPGKKMEERREIMTSSFRQLQGGFPDPRGFHHVSFFGAAALPSVMLSTTSRALKPLSVYSAAMRLPRASYI